MKQLIMCFLIAGTVVVGSAPAQTTVPQSRDNTAGTFTVPQTTKMPEVPSTIPVDGAVNPDAYIVGPSDVFGINIWSITPISLMLPVTPEGSLVIPTVGEVPVADLTLREAKARVLRAIAKKYLSGEPTVTLLAPREVIVTVDGYVRHPGKYTSQAVARVDGVLEDANRFIVPRDTVTVSGEEPFDPRRCSQRHIVVRHRDGSSSRVDLSAYVATRDDRFNPYLRGGDVIVVPNVEGGQEEIAAYGAVLNPSRFEFADGDSLSTLIRLAQGFSDRARADSVVFSRFGGGGRSLETRSLDLRDLSTGHGDFALQPGDRLFVPEVRRDLGDFHVTVEGEVRQPGVYPILRQGTRVSDVLRLCGGPTSLAALNGALLMRRPLNDSQRKRARVEELRGVVIGEDMSYVRQENESRFDGERVDVDFVKLIEQRDSTQDVLVIPGDRLVIPRKVGSVYVFGQVVNPSHVALEAGKSASYYVAQAGGYTERARKSDMVVIKRASRQWLDPGSTTVEDGDAVWVPKERDRDFSYYLGIAGQFASIITTAITVVLLVRK